MAYASSKSEEILDDNEYELFQIILENDEDNEIVKVKRKGRFTKGSEEAKAYMAKLRSMRKSHS